MEALEIVKVYDTKVWVESDMLGSKHVMLQSECPESKPFCYCSFHYGYGYTDNQSVHEAARHMAISLGATEPFEWRMREWPNVKLRGAPLLARPSRTQC